MVDEEFEIALAKCANGECMTICPISQVAGWSKCTTHLARASLAYINHFKSEKQLAETQLRKLLSALYKLTDNTWEAYELCRDDVVKLANDYGVKEEELK